MDSHFIESLTCPICLELVDDAVEASCCHQVFCDRCILSVSRDCCPKCRKPFETLVSHITRRLIDTMPRSCSFPGCNVKLSKSELKHHEKACEQRIYNCPVSSCKYEGLRPDFAAHIALAHEESLVRNAEAILTKSGRRRDVDVRENVDLVATKTNSRGLTCRLGSSGKYYCGQRLDGPRCICCDGGCGPTNGCNCSACMKEDVKTRKLPKNWFVNRDGAVCRIGSETGAMYCGRRVMPCSRSCDGYCGPTNGPNCESCRILHTQISTRYTSVWK